jgi:RNAse (barnase) inhibitor barstar
MAWNVAVVVDPNYSEDAIDQLARYHPVWIVDTPSNRVCAEIARRAAGQMWEPEAACTTFGVTDQGTREQNCLGILEMIELHHPAVWKLDVIGVENAELLTSKMKEFGFLPARATRDDSFAFKRPVTGLGGAPTFQFDASQWKSTDDVYLALFEKIGAPVWHGRNFDALNDSVVTGGINAVEVPYKLVIRGVQKSSVEIRDFVLAFAAFISDREAEGCPVTIQIEK